MAKDKIVEYDATANNNTVVGDVNLAENSMNPSDVNNALREILSHQKEAFGSGTPLYVDQANNRVGVNKTPTVALDVNGALSVSGDITASSLNGGQFAVNNMIINGNMAINQRGATSGVTSGYFVDRFTLSGCSASAVITSSTPTQFPTAITVSATSGNPIISQKIESKNVQHLSGKVVTASFFAKNISNATTLFASLQHANSADNFGETTTITETNLGNLTSDWVKYTASYTVPSGGLNGLSLNILCSGTSTFTMGVTGVMLQEGSVATPFEHRSFGEELALCQRYFHSVNAKGHPNPTDGAYARYITFGQDTNGTRWFYNFPVTMRAIPTLIKNNISSSTVQYFNYNTQGSPAINTIAISESSRQHAQVAFAFSSGVAVGQTVAWRWNNSPNSSFQFNSEL